jgi:ornithine decarboxylase
MEIPESIKLYATSKLPQVESNFGDLFEVSQINLSDIIKENNIKIYKKDDDIYDIINNILENNFSEESFFIVDIGAIIRQYIRWKKFLPDVDLFFAVKSNPTPIIIEVLAGCNASFDCASRSEIASVLSFINDPTRIIYANPIKHCSYIKYARSQDVDLLVCDTEHELYKIKLYHSNCNLVLRIKVDDSKSICKFSKKYGASIEESDKLLEIAKTLSLNVVGISFHIGSGCQDPMQFDNAIKDARKVFDIAKNKFNINMNLLDLGGGFVDETFEETAEIINNSLEKNFGDIENLRVIAESGRMIVNNSHTLVLSIIGKKESIDKETGEKHFTYTINNSVYSAFNNIIFDHAKPTILPFNERNGKKKYNSRIYGITCDIIDMIVDNVILPELVIGEYVYVENFGAYTTASSSEFNGFTKAEYIYVMTC